MKFIGAFVAGMFVVAGVAGAGAQQAPQGTYQSSLDNRAYELRTRGDNGLDLYSDGRIIAVMDRKKPGEAYKGKTKAMAPTCPEADGGEIEIVAMEPERIRARVEHALRATNGQMSCSIIVVIGQSKWTDFNLVRTGDLGSNAVTAAGGAGASGVGASALSGTVDTSSVTTGSLGGIRFRYAGSSVEGNSLTVRVTADNQGNDQPLWFNFNYSTPIVTLIDNAGESHNARKALIGNVDGRSQLVNGVPVTVSLQFDNLPTRGGQILLTEIAKLTMAFDRPKGTVELRHLPLQAETIQTSTGSDVAPAGATAAARPIATPAPAATGTAPVVSSPAAAVTAGTGASSSSASAPVAVPAADAPVLEGNAADIQFRAQTATPQGNALLVALTVTNSKNDRTLFIQPQETTIIDEAGNTYRADNVVIGNQQARAEILSGVPTKITLRFPNMPTARGVITAQEVKRLRVTFSVEDGNGARPAQVEFRNIKITK